MLPAIRISLLALLVLLQLLTPLVHAHAGRAAFADLDTGFGKLHIPGLETLSHAPDGLDGYVQAALSAPSEGVLVDVDSGMKPVQRDVLPDHAVAYYLHTAWWAFSVYLAEPDEVKWLPHPATPIARGSLFTPHAPRAPPFSFPFAWTH